MEYIHGYTSQGQKKKKIGFRYKFIKFLLKKIRNNLKFLKCRSHIAVISLPVIQAHKLSEFGKEMLSLLTLRHFWILNLLGPV